MIEDLIYSTILEIPEIKSNIVKYSGSPAVFYQQIPNDMDKGWKSSSMFPRISYNVNWSYNPERKTDGSMDIDIYCTNENNVSPEDLSISVVNGLTELFLTDESGTYCLVWDRSDSFEVEGGEPLISGVTASFDIVSFPNQEGISPCPIWSVNKFIKDTQPNCVLVGHDSISANLRATSKNPVVYVRKNNSRNISTSYAMAWMNADINISIISSDLEETRKWVSAVLQNFYVERETLMENGSPFLINDISESVSNDPLKTGQIVLSGQYGIMRKEKEGIKLNHAIFSREG